MLLNFALSLFVSITAQANDLSLHTVIEEKKSSLTGSFENTSLSTSEGTISGMGLRASFNHWLNKSYGLEFGTSVAMNNQSGVQNNSFTGFNAFAYYVVWGNPFPYEKKTFVLDKLIVTEKENISSSIFVGAGVTQYFLNGNRGVYSASGIGLGAGYLFTLFNTNFRLSGRWNQLEASQIKVNGMSLDLGVCFSL